MRGSSAAHVIAGAGGRAVDCANLPLKLVPLAAHKST